MAIRLRDDPDWLAAARDLIATLRVQPASAGQVALLAEVAEHFTGNSYPLFLKLLCVVGASNDPGAKFILAETCHAALRNGRLPGGTLSSWGIEHPWQASPPLVQGGLLPTVLRVPQQHLMPIEYLVVWHAQSAGRKPLGEAALRRALSELLHLFSASPGMACQTREHLRAASDGGTAGKFSARVRSYLGEIADRWAAGEAPEAVVEFLAATVKQSNLQEDRWGRVGF